MLWVKAFHVIFVVTWFAGLFYLPRLYVYHSQSHDAISIARFKLMERKLYYGILMPSSILATLLGLWLLGNNFDFYIKQPWMDVKLFCVILLWIFQLMCGKYRKDFAQDRKLHSHVYYRFFNEFPVIILIVVVIMVIVQPFSA